MRRNCLGMLSGLMALSTSIQIVHADESITPFIQFTGFHKTYSADGKQTAEKTVPFQFVDPSDIVAKYANLELFQIIVEYPQVSGVKGNTPIGIWFLYGLPHPNQFLWLGELNESSPQSKHHVLMRESYQLHGNAPLSPEVELSFDSNLPVRMMGTIIDDVIHVK